MRHITPRDEIIICKLINEWPVDEDISWESLRNKISTSYQLGILDIWSRQALSNNPKIKRGYDAARRRIKIKSVNRKIDENSIEESIKIMELNYEIDGMKKKYNALLDRHQKLIHNLSINQKLKSHLYRELPDNRVSQE